MESRTFPFQEMDTRLRSVENTVTRNSQRIDNIEARFDRATRAFYFLGTAFLSFAGVIVGAIIVPH